MTLQSHFFSWVSLSWADQSTVVRITVLGFDFMAKCSMSKQ